MQPAAPQAEPTPTPSPSRAERVFAAASVFPLTAFVLVHVADYSRLLFGASEIGARRSPAAWLIAAEALVVWLPFAGHAVFGAWIWRERRRRPESDVSARTLVALHRGLGIVTALFVADHFVRFRLPVLRGESWPSDTVQRLTRELSSTWQGIPWIGALHLFGTLALSFHLGYGLSRVARRHAPVRMAEPLHALSVALGVATGLFGLFTLLRLATG